MTLPCWIITFDPSSPAASSLGKALAEQGIPHRFVPAVDGRNGTPALQGRERVDARKALLRHQKLLTNSELGCYLAHYRAIQSAYDEGLERVCIMEDDVVPEPALGRVLSDLAKLPDAFEMVRLMALRIRKRKVVSTLSDGEHMLVRPERGWCGGQGYVLSRTGMKKILDHGCNIFEPVDKMYDHFWEYDLHLYGVEPHVLYETEHVSTIQKRPSSPVPIPPHYRVAIPFLKFLFSIGRHLYLRRHHAAFYPATKPEKRMGRTKRLH